MLKIFPIIIAFMYIVIAMTYAVVFVVIHIDSGWSMGAAIEYSLLWPLRVFRDLF
jgi:hypothetical protein